MIHGNQQAAELAARVAGLGAPRGVSGEGAGLAQLWLWLGHAERARAEAERAFADADLRGDEVQAGHAQAVLSALDARSGDLDRALSRADDAIARLRASERLADAAGVMLDVAEALLSRDGPADLSAAAARLAEARTALSTEPSGAARDRLRLLLAWARGATGDVDGAIAELESLEPSVSSARDLAWRVHATLAHLHELRGAEVHARRSSERAMELLEDLATALPREAREHFWLDPRRAAARARASGSARAAASSAASVQGEPARDGRWARLLEITKRLAGEHELDRLLERITDSAVELSGAERGFVLLVGEDGKLAPAAVRDAKSPDDPHVVFSQSIAEAVQIDGEPIVTVDARADGRLSEYLSVHKLMLQSVACLPIRDRSGIVGVLYVEHRVRRGRFRSGDVELLLAFADQAAIALSNARLLGENEKKRRELEAANEALEKAKDEIERLLVARTAELDDARRELGRARDALRSAHDRHGIVGRSEAIRRVLAIVDRVRDASVPVVIHGESGTGKELVARAIHYGSSRARKSFVAVNCAAIPEQLLESELFGHVRGAFTGADRDRTGVLVQASGGTLFLDEIGDMPPKMQVDLLRVLQDGKVRPVGSEEDVLVDVRIVCASNKSLRDQVTKGLFREDLFYRLSVVEIRLPALRERREDIPLLCDHFLASIAKREESTPKRISREAVRRLASHPLPGNVRQLEHVLMNACVMVEGDVIEADDLALLGDDFRPSLDVAPAAPSFADEDDAEDDADDVRALGGAPPANLEEWKTLERRKILEALEATNWNRVRAAAHLGMPRRTFYRRLKEYDIL
ncbi:sigma-54-dependent Fis family transcriptional regulator [Sandaracinus amylolyticus]|uniref:Response regulator of zinc sigma-54-dependent two-component system n=1 Tax=Sandaracinus amylolyticus TaxID=927083 RepID=A0A0F6W635_9BACT|nr:sigma-54-dependent Fis family transcriptional regulator [Sandaracinus amylolyticus]AKF08367.1 Response regulator of zinc sigma-54-dependent two-component system [Sandaracinus amylolyticus]